MKLHHVIITIAAPTETFVGVIEEANYTFEKNRVTLVNYEGEPLRDRQGVPYQRKISAKEDPHIIAGRLLRELVNARGERKFSAPLNYPKLGIV